MKKKETKVIPKIGNMYVLIQEKEQGELICGIKDGGEFIPFGDEDFIDLVTVDTDTIDKNGKAEGYLYRVQICPIIGNIRKNIHSNEGGVDILTVGIEAMQKIQIDIKEEPDKIIKRTKLH